MMRTSSHERVSRLALLVMLPLLALECGVLGRFRPSAAEPGGYALSSQTVSPGQTACRRARLSYHPDQTFATPPLAYDPSARPNPSDNVPRSGANLFASAPPGTTVDQHLGAAVYTRFNGSGVRAEAAPSRAAADCAQTADAGHAPPAVIIF